jgi:hypothetical protein
LSQIQQGWGVRGDSRQTASPRHSGVCGVCAGWAVTVDGPSATGRAWFENRWGRFYPQDRSGTQASGDQAMTETADGQAEATATTQVSLPRKEDLADIPSGTTVDVAVTDLKQHDDDPRSLAGSALAKAAATFAETGPPALTGYVADDDAAATLMLVEGAYYLPALQKAGIQRVAVTVHAYSPAGVQARFLRGEAEVSVSVLKRALNAYRLVNGYAEADNPCAAAAAHATVGPDQVRNLYTLAEVYHRHGDEIAAAFSTEAAATLRKIASEPGGTPAEVQQAIDWHQTKKVAGSLARIVRKPGAERTRALETARQTAASDAEACHLAGWQLVSRYLDAGVELDRIEAALQGELPGGPAPANEADGAAGATTDELGSPDKAAAERARDAEDRRSQAADADGAPADDAGTSADASGDDAEASPDAAEAETDPPARRTARDREKGARFHKVIDRRRFVAAATASDLSHGRPVPPGLQAKALERVNQRARELGLVEGHQTFLRTTRLYEHERGTEKLGVVELAVLVDVAGSVTPLLDSPRGHEVLGEVRRVMKEKGLRVPLDMPSGSPENAFGRLWRVSLEKKVSTAFSQ